MAAKKNNPKRETRIAKNDRNLNCALMLFTAGFIAEFYLLLVSNYYVKGTVDQLVAVARYLEVMAVLGAAAFGAGVVITVMRKKWTRFAAANGWLLGLGAFFAVSSYIMRKIYPAGTTAMCILVPVLMLLAVVFLLYPHEFSVQTVGMTAAITAAVLLNHGSMAKTGLVNVLCWAALVLVAALLALTAVLQKRGGVYKDMTVFPAGASYTLTYAVLAAAAVAIALSLFAGLAYYMIWGTAVLLLLLAVWYTVKML